MSDLEIVPLGLADAVELLDFELENREYFEGWINERGDDFYHLDAVRCSIEESIANRKRDTAYGYLIKADKRIVGRINLTAVSRSYYNKALLGYRVGKKHIGQGFASKAVALLLKEAFDHLRLWRVEASVRTDNTGSIRVLTGNGFQTFGRVHQGLFLNKTWHDLIHFECRSPLGPTMAAQPLAQTL